MPEGWIEAGIAVLEKIRETQGDAIERASEVCAEAIGAGGFVHLFGTGHSRTPVGAALGRVGGLPGPRVGPGSTRASVAIAEAIKGRTAELLLARGELPPVITSVAEVGRRRSDELFEAAYREHARRAAHSLAT